MDPSGTQNKTLPGNQRGTLSGTIRATTSETPKTPITPSSSTPRDINLSYPGKNCSSSMLISSKSVTPERSTPP